MYATILHASIGYSIKLVMQGPTTQRAEAASSFASACAPQPAEWKKASVAPKALSTDLPCLAHHAVQHRPPCLLFHQWR
jgi:hypothetical protein